VDVSVGVSPILDRAGKIAGASTVARDISERKQVEAVLRESEERYRSLFNTLIEGFCTIEMVFDGGGRPVDFRFLEVNPAFETQTGLREAQGKLVSALAPCLERHWFEIYGKILQTGEPAHFENEARPLGRYYDVSAYRIGGSDSQRVAILFNDITERKRAEDEISAAARDQRFCGHCARGLRREHAGGGTPLLGARAQRRPADGRADRRSVGVFALEPPIAGAAAG
jgi:PAS domain S-box-containing protein